MFDLEENEKGQSHRDRGRKEIWCVDVTMGTELIQRCIFKARATVNIYILRDQKWNRFSLVSCV